MTEFKKAMLDAPAQTKFILGLLIILCTQFVTVCSYGIYRHKGKRRSGNISRENYKTGNSVILGHGIREWYVEKLNPFSEIFIKFKIHPNSLSFFGFILAVGAALFFHFGWIGSGGWLVLLSGSFDVIDGAVARKINRSTASGSFFDSILDRYGDMIVQVGLISYYLQPEKSSIQWMVWIVIAGIIGANIIPYSRAKAESFGVEVKVGLMQRPERMVFLGFGAVFSSHYHALLAPWLPQKHYIFAAVLILIVLLSNITAISRFYLGFTKLKQKETEDRGSVDGK